MIGRIALSIPIFKSGRTFFTSSCSTVREIVITKENNVITVEGRVKESDRVPFLLKEETHCVNNACILCKLNLDIKHSDVLILHQFITSEGEMLPRRVTGLCLKQHKRMHKLVAMAQEAGLLGDFVTWEGKTIISERKGYKKPNTYFDERTIDVNKKRWMNPVIFRTGKY